MVQEGAKFELDPTVTPEDKSIGISSSHRACTKQTDRRHPRSAGTCCPGKPPVQKAEDIRKEFVFY